MKIAICDDEMIFVKKTYQYLWQQFDCKIDCFHSPTELLDKYYAGERYDILFLDIIMTPLSGIDVAKEIRKYDKHSFLVFLTSHVEYAPSGYEVNAFRYLLKPVTEDKISHVMQEILTELQKNHTLLIKTPEFEFLLHTQDLQYVEADNKDSILYYRNDSIILRKALNDLESQLADGLFFRIHRKYLVNLTHVREFDETHLTLDCDVTLPISRRRGKDFRLALTAYIEGALH